MIARSTWEIQPWALGVLWLLAGASLVAFLGVAPANRSQEARVLVTAREMVQEGGSRWLLPTCNGELRVQKPPMAYWAAAVLFRATGQANELVGRLPSALWAWLTLGAVYMAGARWFSRSVGLLAAGMLLSSFLFYRYGRLAETDIPATLAVTVAIIAFWSGLELAKAVGELPRAAIWCAIGGAFSGIAFLAKQGPGFYPLLFALAYGIGERNWKGLRTATWAGLIPAVLVAVPWYAYVIGEGHGGVLWKELTVAAEGSDHGGGVFSLVPQLIVATLPWCGLWPVGAVLAWKSRLQTAPMAVLCWTGATFLPLLFVGNRQIHYLMPAMPPLMLLSAWTIQQVYTGAAPGIAQVYVRLALNALMVGAIGGGVVALGWAGAMAVGSAKAAGPHFTAATAVVGALLLVGGLSMTVPMHDGKLFAATLRATAGFAAVFVFLFGLWATHLEPEDVHTAARELQRVADGRRMVFYGEPSLSLVFQLGGTVPVVGKSLPLQSIDADQMAIVVQSRPSDPLATLVQPWHLVWRGGPDGHHYQLWLGGRVAGTETTAHP